jgi:hypothetical protein
MVLGEICPAKTSGVFFRDQGNCPIRFPDFVNHYLLKLSGSVKTFGTNTLKQEYEVEPPP